MYVCVCTGIGDGGNELGMGKVKAAVKAYMPNGNLIACDVAADFAITTGKRISHRPHSVSTRFLLAGRKIMLHLNTTYVVTVILSLT